MKEPLNKEEKKVVIDAFENMEQDCEDVDNSGFLVLVVFFFLLSVGIFIFRNEPEIQVVLEFLKRK